MTTIINIFGGPGCGKSTMASELFSKMKKNGINTELVTEFAKPLAYMESKSIKDQLFVFGNQYHSLWQLVGKCEYVVTDSPILLGIPYMRYPDRNLTFDDSTDEEKQKFKLKEWKDEFESFVVHTHNMFHNKNIFIERLDKEYSISGRLEDEEQAKKIDKTILKILDRNNIKYNTIPYNMDTNKLMEIILEK